MVKSHSGWPSGPMISMLVILTVPRSDTRPALGARRPPLVAVRRTAAHGVKVVSVGAPKTTGLSSVNEPDRATAMPVAGSPVNGMPAQAGEWPPGPYGVSAPAAASMRKATWSGPAPT